MAKITSCCAGDFRAEILLTEVGLRDRVIVNEGVKLGDSITVEVENAEPRDRILTFQMVHD